MDLLLHTRWKSHWNDNEEKRMVVDTRLHVVDDGWMAVTACNLVVKRFPVDHFP